jgi:hypothetical protein
MSSQYQPLQSCDNYLADALERFKREDTNAGLVSLTMALQELTGWAHQIEERLKASDSNQ